LPVFLRIFAFSRSLSSTSPRSSIITFGMRLCWGTGSAYSATSGISIALSGEALSLPELTMFPSVMSSVSAGVEPGRFTIIDFNPRLLSICCIVSTRMSFEWIGRRFERLPSGFMKSKTPCLPGLHPVANDIHAGIVFVGRVDSSLAHDDLSLIFSRFFISSFPLR